MKGIIMAAGRGSRLFPATKTLDKALVPIYDKPLIYYPMSTLIASGVKDILIIVGSGKTNLYREHFGDGSDLGISVQYMEQPLLRGIADAFLIAEDFIAGDPVCLMLGDNIFIGFASELARAFDCKIGATIFAYPSDHPERYGVVWLDDDGNAIALEEKPIKTPTSNLVVPGAYVYDGQACNLAKTLKPSARGELEITDLNRLYLEAGLLKVRKLGIGHNWMDVGNADDVVNASVKIKDIQNTFGFRVGYVEAAAYHNGNITKCQAYALANKYPGTYYGSFLRRL